MFQTADRFAVVIGSEEIACVPMNEILLQTQYHKPSQHTPAYLKPSDRGKHATLIKAFRYPGKQWYPFVIDSCR